MPASGGSVEGTDAWASVRECRPSGLRSPLTACTGQGSSGGNPAAFYVDHALPATNVTRRLSPVRQNRSICCVGQRSGMTPERIVMPDPA
jgi:hypothetical protein